ncbi:MAG TPA: hypothetical protein VHS28_04750 [Chloroflexota bacterium]|nr:hypothetical protein [Chloroflexota bacterium]
MGKHLPEDKSPMLEYESLKPDRRRPFADTCTRIAAAVAGGIFGVMVLYGIYFEQYFRRGPDFGGPAVLVAAAGSVICFLIAALGGLKH